MESFPRVITLDRVARLWRINASTLRDEWRLPFFKNLYADTTGCEIEALEAYHRQCARGFSSQYPLPPVEELLLREVAFLTSMETAEALGLRQLTVARQAQEGRLPALKLGPTWRFPARLIVKICVEQMIETVPIATASQVLGMTYQGTARLAGPDGPLERINVRGTKFAHVTRASFLALLEDLLPEHVDPLEWWPAQLQCSVVVTRKQAARRCHIDEGGLRSLLIERRLPYIMTPNGRMLIPEWVVATLETERSLVPAATLASVLGVTEEIATVWSNNYALCKERHGGYKKGVCPTPSCVATYITNNRMNEVYTADQWLTSVLTDGNIVIRASTLIATSDITKDDIHEAITAGVIHAVRLPPTEEDGQSDIAILQSTAYALLRTVRLRSRREMEDYHLPLNDPRTM